MRYWLDDSCVSRSVWCAHHLLRHGNRGADVGLGPQRTSRQICSTAGPTSHCPADRAQEYLGSAPPRASLGGRHRDPGRKRGTSNKVSHKHSRGDAAPSDDAGFYRRWSNRRAILQRIRQSRDQAAAAFGRKCTSTFAGCLFGSDTLFMASSRAVVASLTA